MTPRALIIALVAAATPLAAHAQSFRVNDLYLISTSAEPEGGGGAARAVLRIDPITWTVEYVAEFTDIFPGRGVHDPYRNRIVISSGTGTLVAADGTRAPLPLTAMADYPASAGDGRLYFFSATTGWAMLDAGNVEHDVVDTNGQVVTRLIHASWFDRGRNRIFTAELGNVVTIRRWDPSPDGTVLEPGPTIATWDVDAGGGDVPVGFSKGPGDTIFLKVDDNTNNTNPRMALLDPDTMTVTTFASSGYFGVGGEVAGCYSPAINKAVVLDSLGDRLRTFAQGEGGAGSIVLECCVSSGGGSGELAQLITIDEIDCPADIDGNGSLNIFDFLAFQTTFSNGDLVADFDGNGLLNIFDFLAFQTAFGNGC